MPLHELKQLDLRSLRERAASDGIAAERIEAARDEDDAKAALIALITESAAEMDEE